MSNAMDPSGQDGLLEQAKIGSLTRDEVELWNSSSLGSRGVSDLANMTPLAFAESIVSASAWPTRDLDVMPSAKLLRAAAVAAMETLDEVRNNPRAPCWRCGGPRSSDEEFADDYPASGEQRGQRQVSGVIVTGPTAFDRLLQYPGLFSTQLEGYYPQLFSKNLKVAVDEGPISKRHMLSISANAVSTRRGGVAANICYGMTQVGVKPTLLSAVGADCDHYLSFLRSTGVDTEFVSVFEREHTPRFDCVTDEDYMQVATFYEGASALESSLSLGKVVDSLEDVKLVLITSAETRAMLRHAHEARERGIPFVVSPSMRLRQGLFNRDQLRELIDGARYLIHNPYEGRLVERTTEWSGDQILQRVGSRITTMGKHGVVVESREHRVEASAAIARHPVDPAGVGDAFRSGFFAGVLHELSPGDCARLGCVMSTLALDVVGTQEYVAGPDEIVKRWSESYRDGSEEEVAQVLFG